MDNLRFKLYLAVDHAQAAALARAQPGPAAAVEQRVGHDDRGLVVGEHAAVLLHVRKNAEVHKQSEASVRHSAAASAQQLGVLKLQLEQAAVESLLGDEDAAAAGEDAVPDGDGVGGDDVEVRGVAAGAGLLRPRLLVPAHIEQLQPVQQDGRGSSGPAPRHADLQGGAPLAAGIEYYLSAQFSLSNTSPT